MSADLCISVRFLSKESHGRGEDGMPEWPPSPLRLFQALTAVALHPSRSEAQRQRGADALRWLERCAPPEILAPRSKLTSAPFRLYVPDNVGDLVAKTWKGKSPKSVADYRCEKDVRTCRLEGETVEFIFRDIEGFEPFLDTLRTVARSMTHLGWGIDQVVGEVALRDRDALKQAGKEPLERWIPGRLGGTALRVAIEGSLAALESRHEKWLHRFEGGRLTPAPLLTTYDRVAYARATDLEPRPNAAFRLLHPLTGKRLWLDPARRGRDVAAWVRQATAAACEGWPFGSIDAIALGQGSDTDAQRRFSYLPLPTFNPALQRFENIARVLVTAPNGMEREIEWISRRLGGSELVWHGEPVARLEALERSDWVLKRYVATSQTWSTVTPVVLPGHDDRSPGKAERLLRRAFLQAGLEPEVVDKIECLEWRATGFFTGIDQACRYLLPDKISGPRFHVRVRFKTQIEGPLAIGSGRHRGLGVFAQPD
ncbi:MAG: type I-U CRISPR-associated protein Cas5/Cas6 [Myxococcales bacterium]|jgi:CRISPR-associated protein Csb2|nr:type I-U CRISPR-associated protein Cas5/Cas6 [Myxococcales bacterium]